MKKIIYICFMLVAMAVCMPACTSIDGNSLAELDDKDDILESRVQERLDSERDIRNSMVQVDVEYGFATIYGPKPPHHVLAKIMSIIKNTPGIKGVETSF